MADVTTLSQQPVHLASNVITDCHV